MTDRHVPGAYANIKAALAAASAGDKIILASTSSPFTGVGNRGITAVLNNIEITGDTDNPADVVVDGSSADFFIDAGSTTDWLLKNFRIDHHVASQPAIKITSAARRWKVRNFQILHALTFTGDGGGMYLDTGGVVGCEVENVIFASCQTMDGSGAGLRHVNGAAKVKNVLFAGCVSSNGGGGLSCHNAQTSTFSFITFFINACIGNGGGFLATDTAAHVYNFRNSIWWNQAATLGKQIHTTAPASVVLDYCLCPNGANDIVGTKTLNNHLTADPLLVPLVGANYELCHLSQVAAGEASNSNCWDSGSETAHAAGMDELTTRTDGHTDTDQVDRGYHYYSAEESDHTLTFQTDGTPGASFTGVNPQFVEDGEDGTQITANAPIGWHFVDWTKGGAFYSAANPLTVLNVTESQTLQANFEIDTHWVTFQTDGTPGSSVVGTTPQTIDYGGDCTAVEAIAPVGWHFVDWSNGGAFYSTDNPVIVTNVITDMQMQANFEIDTHTVTFQTDGTPGAAIAGDTPQVIDYGGNCTAVTAIAPAFFYFAGWTIGGLVISINEMLVFPNVTHDTTIQANFLPGVYVCIDHKCEIVDPGIVGPNLSYMNFAGMLSGTVQTYRQNNTARKLGSRLGVT